MYNMLIKYFISDLSAGLNISKCDLTKPMLTQIIIQNAAVLSANCSPQIISLNLILLLYENFISYAVSL